MGAASAVLWVLWALCGWMLVTAACWCLPGLKPVAAGARSSAFAGLPLRWWLGSSGLGSYGPCGGGPRAGAEVPPAAASCRTPVPTACPLSLPPHPPPVHPELAPSGKEGMVRDAYAFLARQGAINFGLLRKDPRVPLPAGVAAQLAPPPGTARRPRPCRCRVHMRAYVGEPRLPVFDATVDCRHHSSAARPFALCFCCMQRAQQRRSLAGACLRRSCST